MSDPVTGPLGFELARKLHIWPSIAEMFRASPWTIIVSVYAGDAALQAEPTARAPVVALCLADAALLACPTGFGERAIGAGALASFTTAACHG